MRISLSINTPDTIMVAQRQAPFAIALALTRTAQDVQQEVRGKLPGQFKLRNSWTARNIRITRAERGNLQATIAAPDYMAKQETGETEYPSGGRRYLAAPGPAINTNRVTPQGLRPRALLGAGRKAFVITMPGGGGKAAIVERRTRKRSPLRILWWLTTDQQNTPRFEFLSTAEQVVHSRYALRFNEAFKRALATAR